MNAEQKRQAECNVSRRRGSKSKTKRGKIPQGIVRQLKEALRITRDGISVHDSHVLRESDVRLWARTWIAPALKAALEWSGEKDEHDADAD